MTALGRTWHPEHFVCSHCRQELGTQNFFERDGQPYCEPDYHHLFSPRCAYCNGPILDVRAATKTLNPSSEFAPLSLSIVILVPTDRSVPISLTIRVGARSKILFVPPHKSCAHVHLLCINRFFPKCRAAGWADEWMDDVRQLLLRVMYHLAASCLLMLLLLLLLSSSSRSKGRRRIS